MIVADQLSELDKREQLVEKVLARLASDKRVEKVELIGSLAKGNGDCYSDMDVAAHVSGISDRDFAELVPDLLRPIGPTLVEGWGLGFLPETFIRTLYFEHYPLFWHIDVSCLSGRHSDGNDILESYHWPQIFKIWLSVVKEYLRGQDQIEYLTSLMSWADLSAVTGSRAEKLSKLLDICGARAARKGAPYAQLFHRCDELRREYLC